MSSDFRFISTVYLRTFSQKFHFSDDYGTLGIKWCMKQVRNLCPSQFPTAYHVSYTTILENN